jgi:hypothetical protein
LPAASARGYNILNTHSPGKQETEEVRNTFYSNIPGKDGYFYGFVHGISGLCGKKIAI